MAQGLSVHAFAKLAGVSHSAITRAVHSGRLPLLAEGGIDPKHARSKTWLAQPHRVKPNGASNVPNAEPAINLDGSPRKKKGRPLQRPTDAPPTTASEYARITLDKERALAGLRELEYQQRAGSLIELATAQRLFFESHRAVRDSWLNWPARIAPHVAAELGVEVEAVLLVLTRHVREHMVALAEPEPDFRSSES